MYQRRLSDKALIELIAIVKDEFGQELTLDQAEEMGIRVLEFFELISRPSPDKQHQARTQLRGRFIDCIIRKAKSRKPVK